MHDSDANVSAGRAVQTIATPAGLSVRCLVCGGTHAKQRFVQRGYPVLRCADCGMEFVAPTPSPSELADYYDRSYAVPLELYAAASERNAARIADLERWSPARGRLLELGASYGHSLAAARDRGWDVVGVELSPTASTYARTHFGLTVLNCDLADARLADASFDAVIGWHVLEHVRNPRDQLLRLASLLKPGGVLGLRVPNVASFGARAAGQWWPWMCPPAHLWFFSSASLQGNGGEISARASLGTAPAAQPASGLLEAWLQLLGRAQPITNALARASRPLIEPIEGRGWGDELL